MTITRSLLSKLHLPYKQLGVEGSRGDQLYLPDDVGVNLSLSHGLNGSDMIPIASDNKQSLSTRIEGYPSAKRGVELITLLDTIHVVDNGSTNDIDISNYGMLVFIMTGIAIDPPGNIIDFRFNIRDNHGVLFGANGFNGLSPPDTEILAIGGSQTPFLIGDKVQIQWLLQAGTVSADFYVDAFVA